MKIFSFFKHLVWCLPFHQSCSKLLPNHSIYNIFNWTYQYQLFDFPPYQFQYWFSTFPHFVSHLLPNDEETLMEIFFEFMRGRETSCSTNCFWAVETCVEIDLQIIHNGRWWWDPLHFVQHRWERGQKHSFCCHGFACIQ